METHPERERESTVECAPQDQAMARAAMGWMSQLGRTLKTCRLYDSNNPTVVRFREDLATVLSELLSAHGPLTLRFTSNDILLGETSLYPARSREDNLAMPFFRDGIRSLTISPGIEAAELETVLDQILRVTSHERRDEDLVTLLWDAQLHHVDLSYVSAEADLDSEGEGSDSAPSATTSSAPAPWPRASAPAAAVDGSPDAPPASDFSEEADGTTRSDDWTSGVLTGEIDAALGQLEAVSAAEVSRFRAEHHAEYTVSPLTSAIDVVADCLEAGATAADRADLAGLLARLARESIALGGWSEGRRALQLLNRCESATWSPASIAEDLGRVGSVATVAAVRHLDQQPASGVQEFLAMAREFDAHGIEWLMSVLATSQQQRTRRPLARVIAELSRGNPERLSPWVADSRWYVVRNVVHILGWIGGGDIVSLLKAAAKHPEVRVRHEVVAAMAQVESGAGRELLVSMLHDPEGRIFCAALHQLSTVRDPRVAQLLIGFLQAPEFEQRSLEERRAVYLALASVGDDAILAELDTELHLGKRFSNSHEQHQQALARCIARIATPLARHVLEQGAKSRNHAVRKACQDALGEVIGHD